MSFLIVRCCEQMVDVAEVEGRGTPQSTPQNDPIVNTEANTLSGIFGGFLDSTQMFKNYFGGNTEQSYTQPPSFGMGIGQPHVMHFIQSTLGNTPIQPNTPYISGTSTTFVYQQSSTISPQ